MNALVPSKMLENTFEFDSIPEHRDAAKNILRESDKPIGYFYSELLFGAAHEYEMIELGYEYVGKRDPINFGAPSRDGIWVKKI